MGEQRSGDSPSPKLSHHTTPSVSMTVAESLKSAASTTGSTSKFPFVREGTVRPEIDTVRTFADVDLYSTAATKQEMSDARLPLAYRDSCAHLLIPLNRCRYEEYYLPWKCEV